MESILKELMELLEKSKQERKGFILLPSFEGFKLFEIDSERLELYLKMDTLYKGKPFKKTDEINL
jgi:hypothetical protein